MVIEALVRNKHRLHRIKGAERIKFFEVMEIIEVGGTIAFMAGALIRVGTAIMIGVKGQTGEADGLQVITVAVTSIDEVNSSHMKKGTKVQTRFSMSAEIDQVAPIMGRVGVYLQK
jgi:hypothetical protein